MKRIKADEIQETLKTYLKQRNLTLRSTPSTPTNQNPRTTQALDLNKIVLTDSALVESSINDYYSYCLNSPSFETDYLKEFESLKGFVQQSESFTKVLYPILVYMCIDLIKIGISIKDKVKKLFEDVLDDEVKSLVDDLIQLEESKGQEKSKKILELVENKWRIYLNAAEWRTFLNFFINSRSYLLLRIVNMNMQIVKVDDNQSIIDLDEIQQPMTLVSETMKPAINKTNQSQEKPIINSRTNTDGTINSSINLKSLRECIQMIRCKPPTINGACCFYLTDPQHKITSASMSPDYQYASFTSEDSSIYLHDLSTSNTSTSSSVKLTGGHSSTVLKSRFTHDSSYLLSSDFDGLVCLWRMSNLDRNHHRHRQSSILPVVSYSGHSYPVWDLDPFSSLNLFATASKDATARLWSFDRLYPLRVYAGHHADVNCVRFHPNASYLATASSDKTVRMWSVQSCEFVRLFSGHRGRVFALAFSPDGNYLASAGEDRKVKIWDLRMGTQLKEYRSHTNFIHSLAFDNHSQVLCSGGIDRSLKFWDFTGGQQMKQEPKTATTTSTKTPATNDLLSSAQLEFDVYSVSVDSHNVFYACGARKEAVVIPQIDCKQEENKVVEKSEKIEVNETTSTSTTTKNSSPLNNETTSTRKVGVSTRKSSATAKNVPSQPQPQAAAANTSSNNSNYNFLNNDDLYEV